MAYERTAQGAHGHILPATCWYNSPREGIKHWWLLCIAKAASSKTTAAKEK